MQQNNLGNQLKLKIKVATYQLCSYKLSKKYDINYLS